MTWDNISTGLREQMWTVASVLGTWDYIHYTGIPIKKGPGRQTWTRKKVMKKNPQSPLGNSLPKRQFQSRSSHRWSHPHVFILTRVTFQSGALPDFQTMIPKPRSFGVELRALGLRCPIARQ